MTDDANRLKSATLNEVAQALNEFFTHRAYPLHGEWSQYATRAHELMSASIDDPTNMDWDGLDVLYLAKDLGYIEDLGHVTVESETGGEGEGYDVEVVLAIGYYETVRYFCKQGYYISHDGTYLDGRLIEVTPKSRYITVFEEL